MDKTEARAAVVTFMKMPPDRQLRLLKEDYGLEFGSAQVSAGEMMRAVRESGQGDKFVAQMLGRKGDHAD